MGPGIKTGQGKLDRAFGIDGISVSHQRGVQSGGHISYQSNRWRRTSKFKDVSINAYRLRSAGRVTWPTQTWN